MQRNLRKIELKKEAVVRKQQINEIQVAQRKAQQEQAIQLKRDLNAQMINERKQVKDEIGFIDNLSIQNVDKALAKVTNDGSIISPPKRSQTKGHHASSDNVLSEGGGGYRGGGNGW